MTDQTIHSGRRSPTPWLLALLVALLLPFSAVASQPPSSLPSLTITMVDLEQGLTLVAGNKTFLTDAQTQIHDARRFRSDEPWQRPGTVFKVRVRDGSEEANAHPVADEVWIVQSPIGND